MKKRRFITFMLMACVFSFVIWQVAINKNENTSDRDFESRLQNNALYSIKDNNSGDESNQFYRDAKVIDYSSLKFTPWDAQAASAFVTAREPKLYTIMVYMNGSDLESENGAATEDMIEMLESGLNSKNANIVLFTGGTNRWQNNVVPENECVLWEIADGNINRVTGVGLVNMGDSGTLSSFIDFSMESFPADKYGLILWDHGGGSIAGYGKDEKYKDSNLMLLGMNYAFEKSKLSNEKLEFLGFDSCLMATVEMAVVASDYANFLIASEETEPGPGWDYQFLRELNNNSAMDGALFGKVITDYYMDFYGKNTDEDLTMSVIDLSEVDRVMSAMGKLMDVCSDALLNEKKSSFRALARKRNGTKTFGAGSPINTETDMVDIGDMAAKLSDLFPDESQNLQDALVASVVYNRHNLDTDLKGLSTYYAYEGREGMIESLNIYQSLNMDEKYTNYLFDFANLLNDDALITNKRQIEMINPDANDDLINVDLTMWEPVKDKQGYFMMAGIQCGVSTSLDAKALAGFSELWPQINGQNVCMYKLSSSRNHTYFAIPSEVNGKDCDLIVLVSENHPEGLVLGTRQEDGFIIQKGYDKLEIGDTISFYYQIRNFENPNYNDMTNWEKSDALIVNGELKLDWVPVSENSTKFCLLMTDFQNNKHFCDLKNNVSELIDDIEDH